MVEAIILAAGYASRADGFKMAFMIDNQPILQRVIQAFLPICDQIYVVGGYQSDKLNPLLDIYDNRVKLVLNEHYDLGMFSSVQTGVNQIQGDYFFITPGDYPFITTDICREMLTYKADIVIPSFEGRGGHPLLLSKDAKTEILSMSPHQNLKVFLQGKKITYVNVNDEGVLQDLDTPQDYEKYQKRMDKMKEVST